MIHTRTRGRHAVTRTAQRRPVIALVSATATVAVAAATLVAPSSAAWTDVEYIASEAGTLVCDGVTPAVDARAWGRVLSAALAGASLDSIASTDGISVSNLDPATTSTGVNDAGGQQFLAADAWVSPLSLNALNLVSLAPGVTLPLNAGTGVYSQYGRATASGVMTGASGAVTTAAGGLVSLDGPGTSAPRLGTLRLSTVLDSVLPGLGVGTGQLADVDLEIGAVGSVTSLDGCDALWDASSLASELDRDYLVASLGLGLTSNVLSGLGQSLDAALVSLQTTLNSTLNADVPGALVDTLEGTLLGPLDALAGISLGSDPLTVSVTGAVDLTSVRGLLTNTLSDGVVSVNLSTGRLSVDLAALLGDAYADSNGLNGRGPNTSVLTPDVINALLVRVSTILEDFISSTVQDALLAALLNTVVVVDIGIELDVFALLANRPDALKITATVTGSLGGLAGRAGYAAPSTSYSTGFNLTGITLVDSAIEAVVGSLLAVALPLALGTVLPSVSSAVVSPLLATLEGLISSTVAGIVGTTLPAVVTQLGGVLTVLSSVVRVLLNAQPDQPNGVAAPAVASTGRWFVSALHVGVVNGGASLLDVWAASSSVGPYAKR